MGTVHSIFQKVSKKEELDYTPAKDLFELAKERNEKNWQRIVEERKLANEKVTKSYKLKRSK